MHLIVKRIMLDDRKHIGSVELAFNEETEKHFLSLTPSAEPIAQGAFPLSDTLSILLPCTMDNVILWLIRTLLYRYIKVTPCKQYYR